MLGVSMRDSGKVAQRQRQTSMIAGQDWRAQARICRSVRRRCVSVAFLGVWEVFIFNVLCFCFYSSIAVYISVLLLRGELVFFVGCKDRTTPKNGEVRCPKDSILFVFRAFFPPRVGLEVV